MTEPDEAHSEKILELANEGIGFGVRNDHARSVRCWEAASHHAEVHLKHEDIYYWVMSGYGAALYEIGEFEKSIDASKKALNWCSKIDQPLPAITMAKSYIRLKDQQAARKYLDEARRLAGETIRDHFDADDRAFLGYDI